MRESKGKIKISFGVAMLLIVTTILATVICVTLIIKDNDKESNTNNTNNNLNINTENYKNNTIEKNEISNELNENVLNTENVENTLESKENLKEKELINILKEINKEEKENNTYGSTILQLSEITKKTEESYIAKIEFYESVKITKNEYNKLKTSGKIEIDGIIFEYKEKSRTENADFETVVGTGEKHYLEYEITKVGDEYELRGLAGPALPMYKLKETKYFEISKDIKVTNLRNDGIDELNEITEGYLKKNKTNVEFYNNELRIYIDNK